MHTQITRANDCAAPPAGTNQIDHLPPPGHIPQQLLVPGRELIQQASAAATAARRRPLLPGATHPLGRAGLSLRHLGMG
jgi:hypothetical protein